MSDVKWKQRSFKNHFKFDFLTDSFGSKVGGGRGSKSSSQRGSARTSFNVKKKNEKRRSIKEKEDLRRTKTFRKIEAELTEKVK